MDLTVVYITTNRAAEGGGGRGGEAETLRTAGRVLHVSGETPSASGPTERSEVGRVVAVKESALRSEITPSQQ